MPQKLPFLNLEDLKTINFSETLLVETTQEDCLLTVADIINKLGEEGSDLGNILRLLGEETVLCRLFFLNDKVYCSIPKIYRDESNNINLYDAKNDPDPIKADISFIEYHTDFTLQTEGNIFSGYQLIAIASENNLAAFRVPFSIHTDFQNTINEKYNPEKPNEIESLMPKSKGAVSPNIINYYPRSVVPMSHLEIGETLQVKGDLGLDPRRPGATRFQVQKMSENEPIGEIFEVWANYYLRQHYKQYGTIPCTVISKEEKDNRKIIKFARADLARVS